MRGGELKFPDPDEIEQHTAFRPDGTYRTLFGPCIAHSGLVNCNCDHCMSLALRRLTALREASPDRIQTAIRAGLNPAEISTLCDSYDDLLRTNQAAYLPKIHGLLADLKRQYGSDMPDFSNVEEMARLYHADPHPKQKLRIRAFQELNESGEIFKHLWLRKALIKFKKDEIAKNGKKPRSIVDLGVSASLQGFMATRWMKYAMERHPLVTPRGSIEFVSSPRVDVLKRVFDQLLSPEESSYMVYFSDDSCYSFRHRGKLYRYNLDIAGCDASHGPAIFDALLRITPDALLPCMRILVDQCMVPITIVSTSSRRRDGKRLSIRGYFDGPTLFSGSTITTLINNLANLLLGHRLSLVTLDDRDYTDTELNDIFSLALEEVGYVVTGFTSKEKCHVPEDLQFLKYSPALDVQGDYWPVLNFGVWLRASGTCRGDLPGGKNEPIEQRAKSFQYALLQGMFPRLQAPLIRNFKEAAKPDDLLSRTYQQSTTRVAYDLSHKVEDSEHPDLLFDDDAIMARYQLTPSEYQDLTEFSRAGFGIHACMSFADKILRKDYGLGTLSWQDVCRKEGTW